ncbi:MAG: MFS transporter [Alphaproteobacteria bacterium]|nr:MFS transporter [Alphaproteobacteria bacterium]MBL7097711.1 MFS transporter [Alphaproteobacteria bacterium]
MSDARPAGPTASPHPIVYLLLCIPFGASAGYLVVTLGYLLHQAGVSVSGVAALIAVSFIPQTWKFVWAPVVDTTMTSKSWFILSAVVNGGTLIAVGLFQPGPATLPIITGLIFLNSLSTTFQAMAAENLMAHATNEAEKGRAGGWYQAGNLGGQGIGGGVALWIAQHTAIGWLPGAFMAALFAACCVALLFIAEPPADHRHDSYARSLWNVMADVWNTAKARGGYLALLICFVPIGSGAAANLWSSVAGDWHADADTVALVNGILGGMVSAVGCVVGGYLCDRMDRKLTYAVFGAALALATLAMAAMSRTVPMFVFFTLLYAFIQGFNYASFSAVVLEAIGKGAAATKYNIFAALSNFPIQYVGLLDGWAYERWHTNGFLAMDAVTGLVGVAIFYAVAIATAPRAVSRPA